MTTQVAVRLRRRARWDGTSQLVKKVAGGESKLCVSKRETPRRRNREVLLMDNSTLTQDDDN